MNIHFCVPNHKHRLEKLAPFSVENLGVAYLLSEFQERGWNANVIDAYLLNLSQYECTKKLLSILKDEDIVCFTVMQQTADYVKDVCSYLRSNAFNGIIIIGGWLNHQDTKQMRHFFSDSNLILSIFSANKAASVIENFIKKDNWKQNNLLPTYISDGVLDNPRKNWRLPYHYAYIEDDYSKSTSFPMPILSTVGCYWGRCTFCATASRWHSKQVVRSAESIFFEMLAVHKMYGIQKFSFVDDCFFTGTNVGMERAQKLSEMIISEKLDIEFTIDCRVSDIDMTTFSYLVSAGLRSVYIGIENFSTTVLKRFCKGFTFEQCIEGLAKLRKLDLKVSLGYITFEPFMEINEAEKSIKFLRDYFPEEAASRLRDKIIPYPETEIFHKLNKFNLLKGTYPNYTFKFYHSETEGFYRTIIENRRIQNG